MGTIFVVYVMGSCVYAKLAVRWADLSSMQYEYPPNHSVITPKSLRNHPLLDAVDMLNSVRLVCGNAQGQSKKVIGRDMVGRLLLILATLDQK